MPIYEYKCRACGEVSEVVRVKAAAPPLCPANPEHGPAVRIPSLPASLAGPPVTGGDGAIAPRGGSYNYLVKRSR